MNEAICPACSRFHAAERGEGKRTASTKARAQRIGCVLCKDTQRVPAWVAQRYLDALRGVTPGLQTVAFRRYGAMGE